MDAQQISFLIQVDFKTNNTNLWKLPPSIKAVAMALTAVASPAR